MSTEPGTFIINGCDIGRIARLVDSYTRGGHVLDDDGVPGHERDIAHAAYRLLVKMRSQGYIEAHQEAHVMRFITSEAKKAMPVPAIATKTPVAERSEP